MENQIFENLFLKKKIKQYFEESKENIEFKANQISSLIKSIKDENLILLSKSKQKYINNIYNLTKLLIYSSKNY